MAAGGWVYIISHPRMGRAVKIGGTARTPERRVAELSTAALPEPFRLHHAAHTRDWRGLETALHHRLAPRRMPNSEWFAVSPRRARKELERLRGRTAPARFLPVREWLARVVLRPVSLAVLLLGALVTLTTRAGVAAIVLTW
ncbi:T5orf172 domain-containing protein [Limimonas halophila]|uniref:T5orf172 domain-containing protein n=1 Tax=Limimonas halophila TaxID=1082479 RepID=A0A1G7QWX9_9PROT|nr:GIY-YIG nuclease family protein [Limimonas halophila]SDG03012.1 T5orf172 domain-containing protein [Limimonas halophila]